MRKITVVLVVAMMVTIGVGAGSLDGYLSARLELETGTTWIAADQAVTIRFTIENTSDQPISLLRWQTPVFGMEAPLFEISRDGQPVAYTGILIKRAEPTEAEFFELGAGESMSAVFDPTAVYEMGASGEYTIRYVAELDNVKAVSRGKVMTVAASATLRSNELSFFAEGLPWFDAQRSVGDATKGVDCNRNPCHPKCPPNPDLCGGGDDGGGSTGSITFINCASKDQSKIIGAVEAATTISRAAANDLSDGSSSLYSTWFGAYTSSRFSTVSSHFDSIANAFETKTVTINCSDQRQPYYAYVYPNNPYEIYVCKYFFLASTLGRDSKAGTLVHEMSHFNVTAGTDDYVYGASGAMNLAITDPNKAINNADNHEYFAEDQ